jgi:hypothetical protein
MRHESTICPNATKPYPTIAMHRKPIEALADTFTEAEEDILKTYERTYKEMALLQAEVFALIGAADHDPDGRILERYGERLNAILAQFSEAKAAWVIATRQLLVLFDEGEGASIVAPFMAGQDRA